MRAMTRGATAIAAGMIACSGLLAVAGSATAGGKILPPTARANGLSLTDIARIVAPFTAAGNDPALLQPTPVQVLHYDPATAEFSFGDGGITATGSGRFTVPTGTMFYIPVFNADDTGLDAPFFPTDDAGGVAFFFGRSQFGAEGITIIVDGQATVLGPDYLSGLLSFSEPLASGATRVLTVGAFLTPLPPGTHTITIRAAFTGAAFPDRYGLAFFAEDITYTVEVVPGRRASP
ncbi:hypothetical protein EP7_002728 [Isosphaeraceae bacterium EP7]